MPRNRKTNRNNQKHDDHISRLENALRDYRDLFNDILLRLAESQGQALDFDIYATNEDYEPGTPSYSLYSEYYYGDRTIRVLHSISEYKEIIYSLSASLVPENNSEDSDLWWETTVLTPGTQEETELQNLAIRIMKVLVY